MNHALSLYFIVLIAVLSSIAHKGSKVLVSLSALDLGASGVTVGILAALYAVFPLLLAVYAGRVSDRMGVRTPLLLGALGMTGGLLLPSFNSSMPMLFACPLLIGLGHIFLHVSVHNAVGSVGVPSSDSRSTRAANFATFSLGASVAAFIGPSLTGVLIDSIGFRASYLTLAAFSGATVLLLLFFHPLLPTRIIHEGETAAADRFDLWRDSGLRRTLITSGVAITGIELFSFYLPIYGKSIGLSASWIGLVLGSYAAAAFVVRVFMPKLTLRFTELGVLTGALFAAAITYLAIPFITMPWLLVMIAFTLGLGLGTAQPLTIMLTYHHAPPGRSGEALGMRLTVNKLTQIVVPLVFGGIGSAFGVAPVFWGNALFLFIGALLSMRNHAQMPTVDDPLAKNAADETPK